MIKPYVGIFILTLFIVNPVSAQAQPHTLAPHKTTTITTPSGQKFTNIEAEGNLTPTHALKCIPLQSVKPEYTPADLHGAARECIQKERYEDTMHLYMIAGAYGYFDGLRITDETARQAGRMLAIQTNNSLTPKQTQQWQSYVRNYSSMPPEAALCQRIKNLGPPTYYPSYMIQHGLAALTKSNTKPLIEDFDAQEGWKKALQGYLSCTF